MVPTLDKVRAGNEADLDRLEAHLQSRLGGRIQELHISLRDGGLLLEGRAHTYYAKQLAQHAVMDVTDRPIFANEICVS